MVDDADVVDDDSIVAVYPVRVTCRRSNSIQAAPLHSWSRILASRFAEGSYGDLPTKPRKETIRQDEVSKTAPCITKRGSYREILEENKKIPWRKLRWPTNNNQERKPIDRMKSQKPPHASPNGEAIAKF
jgi:hypothetical protein